jgi:D-sedoheptulose 7-phosphate isomerase
MKNTVLNELNEHLTVFQDSKESLVEKIKEISILVIEKLNQGNKLIFCGNGGSAADSQHIAAEIVGRFKKERRSLPAIAITTDTSVITAIGNDYGYENIFKRQIEAIARKDDIFFAISTSGNSLNIINAIDTAKKSGCLVIGFSGLTGGKMNSMCDLMVNVKSNNTARIQEMHILIFHVICQLIDKNFSN